MLWTILYLLLVGISRLVTAQSTVHCSTILGKKKVTHVPTYSEVVAAKTVTAYFTTTIHEIVRETMEKVTDTVTTTSIVTDTIIFTTTTTASDWSTETTTSTSTVYSVTVPAPSVFAPIEDTTAYHYPAQKMKKREFSPYRKGYLEQRIKRKISTQQAFASLPPIREVVTSTTSTDFPQTVLCKPASSFS